jgi:hypothetical protein
LLKENKSKLYINIGAKYMNLLVFLDDKENIMGFISTNGDISARTVLSTNNIEKFLVKENKDADGVSVVADEKLVDVEEEVEETETKIVNTTKRRRAKKE